MDPIWNLGVTDGASAAQNASSTAELTHFYSLKKKGDKRLQGGKTFEEFLQMKQEGQFGDFNLQEDTVLQALFLQ